MTEKAKVSSVALRTLNILLLKNPERTALGVMLGFSLNGFAKMFGPVLLAHHIAINEVSWWCFLSLGIVALHLPFVLSSIHHKPVMTDEIDGLIKLIESTNIGDIEKRQAYRRVVDKCIENFSLNAATTTMAPSKEDAGVRETIREILEG